MRFLHLSDLHFHGDASDNTEIMATLAMIKANYPEHYLIITGDIVEHGTEAQYEQAQAALMPFNEKKQRVFIVPGNHDFGTKGFLYSQEKARRFDEMLAIPLKQGGTFKGDNIPVVNIVKDTTDTVMLIGLDSNLETDTPVDIACGEIGEGQRKALDTILSMKTPPNMRKILFFHHHLLYLHITLDRIKNSITSVFSDPTDILRGIEDLFANGAMKLKDADELIKIISNRVDVVLFGHKHVSGMWPDAAKGNEQQAGIPYVLASDNTPGKDKAREIDVTNGVVTVREVPIK
ncbi:Metallophosphoesterase domain protein [Candidatus Magnetobacterium bavaricum]|uniref:Metallophosphoesterase domain protein n=1 Tax=Candidatus Magnetobacterium bavaricum TaxID=29290 RepID=A0A0F3GLS3_9BACT|nr:Metallophosphoesterase domain protein [Candidatus Magnetobacterium bavaricum]